MAKFELLEDSFLKILWIISFATIHYRIYLRYLLEFSGPLPATAHTNVNKTKDKGKQAWEPRKAIR